MQRLRGNPHLSAIRSRPTTCDVACEKCDQTKEHPEPQTGKLWITAMRYSSSSAFIPLQLLIILWSLLGAACNKPKQPYSVTSDRVDGSERWIYTAPNGIVLTTRDDRVDLLIGINQSVSFRYDPQSRSASRLVLETPGSGEANGQWVTDSNWDGLPETRRQKGGGKDLYFRGKWHNYKSLGDAVVIEEEGRAIYLQFDGEKWLERQVNGDNGVKQSQQE